MRYSAFGLDAGPAAQHFCLYAAGGRIYVQNADTFLIDIGEFGRSDDGFAYRIDGDASLGGSGFGGADDVLHDLAGQLDLPFLDIRFRTLPDHSEDYSVNLYRAAHCAVSLASPAADDARVGASPALIARARHSALA